MSLTGKVLLTCDLARRYDIKDTDGEFISAAYVDDVESRDSNVLFISLLFPGRSVTDYTSLKFLLSQVPYLSWLSPVVPSFLHLPRFVLTLAGNRF